MRWLQSFWGPEVAHFGPLYGPLSIDLEIPFFRLKLGVLPLYFNNVKFHLNPFSRFRFPDLFPKILRCKPLRTGSNVKKCVRNYIFFKSSNSE